MSKIQNFDMFHVFTKPPSPFSQTPGHYWISASTTSFPPPRRWDLARKYDGIWRNTNMCKIWRKYEIIWKNMRKIWRKMWKIWRNNYVEIMKELWSNMWKIWKNTPTIYILGLGEISRCPPLYRLWDFEKFRAPPSPI